MPKTRPGASRYEASLATFFDLFDPLYRDRVCESVACAIRPDRASIDAGLSRTLDRLICEPLEAFIKSRVEEKRPNVVNDDMQAAKALLIEVRVVIRMVNASQTGGEETIVRLRAAWVEFVAACAAYRMYDDLRTEMAKHRKLQEAGRVHRHRSQANLKLDYKKLWEEYDKLIVAGRTERDARSVLYENHPEVVKRTIRNALKKKRGSLGT